MAWRPPVSELASPVQPRSAWGPSSPAPRPLPAPSSLGRAKSMASRRILRNRIFPSPPRSGQAQRRRWETPRLRSEVPQPEPEQLLRFPLRSRAAPPETPNFQALLQAHPKLAAKPSRVQNSPARCLPPASEPVPPTDSRHVASATPATPHSTTAEEEPGTSVRGLGAAHPPAGSPGRGNGHPRGPETTARSVVIEFWSLQVAGSELRAAREPHRSRRSGIRGYSRDRIDCSALP